MHTNTVGTKDLKAVWCFFFPPVDVKYDFCRCMVEAGYDYSTDCLPDPAVWEQMLNKSPIKYITQVWIFLDYVYVSSVVFF